MGKFSFVDGICVNPVEAAGLDYTCPDGGVNRNRIDMACFDGMWGACPVAITASGGMYSSVRMMDCTYPTTQSAVKAAVTKLWRWCESDVNLTEGDRCHVKDLCRLADDTIQPTLF